MAKKSLIKLLLCLAFVIATVGMAAANGPEIMVYSGSIPQGVNQGDGTYEISFSIYASEKGGSALWTETQNVFVYQGTFAVYLGAVQKLNLAFDVPYWVGVKAGGKEDIWPLTGAGYPMAKDGGVTSLAVSADSETGTHAPSLAVAADAVLSASIKEADGTSGQNTNAGSGIKTGHIQNSAVTTAKIKKDAILSGKIAAGAVTDEKITGPISASKIEPAFVLKSGDTMTGRLTIKGDGFPSSFLYLDTNAAAEDSGIRFYENGTVKSHLFWDSSAGTLNLFADGGAFAKGIEIDTSGNVTATGSVTATSFSGVKKTACPTYYTKIEFTNSTLCIQRTLSAYNWAGAENTCYGYSTGQICTQQQVRRACKHGSYTLTTGTWMADRVADDRALYVNGTDCENFDGDDNSNSGSHNAYCCLEWMKY